MVRVFVTRPTLADVSHAGTKDYTSIRSRVPRAVLHATGETLNTVPGIQTTLSEA